jgi:hypothetical protein
MRRRILGTCCPPTPLAHLSPVNILSSTKMQVYIGRACSLRNCTICPCGHRGGCARFQVYVLRTNRGKYLHTFFHIQILIIRELVEKSVGAIVFIDIFKVCLLVCCRDFFREIAVKSVDMRMFIMYKIIGSQIWITAKCHNWE